MKSEMFSILMTLMTKDKVSADELAEKYEISKRSVYRYVDKMSAAGIPIWTQPGCKGGIVLDADFKIRCNYFSKEEMQRLLDCVDGFPLQDETTDSVREKLGSLSRARADLLLRSNQLIVETALSESTAQKLNILKKCITACWCAEVDYRDDKGARTKRIIEPMSLVLKEGLWYVFSFCRLRNDFRYFKLSRIENVRELCKLFRPKDKIANPKEIGANRQAEKVEIVLSVSPAALTHVAEWLGFESIQTDDDGVSTARAKVPYDDYLVSKLLSLGQTVKVVSPNDLKDKVTAALRTALKSYSD